MPAITKYALEALKYAGGEVTVNLRHSTTDLYRVPPAAASERAASPTFIAKSRNSVLDAVHTALQSAQQGAQQLLQKNLAHYNPLAAVAFNSATALTAKLRATDVMKKVEAVPKALAASVGGLATGLGHQAAASAYELLPMGLRSVAQLQIADPLSRATNGVSRAITDPMRELRQSHEQVSDGLHTLMTQPLSVAQHAWATYQNNVLNNSLKTPDDVFRGVKTIADVALVAGPMRALGPVGTSSAAQRSAASGRTIDLSPQDYWVVREGQKSPFAPATPSALPPPASATHVQTMALKAALPDTQVLRRGMPLPTEPVWAVAEGNARRLTPTQLDLIAPGFQFTEITAHPVTAHQVSDASVAEGHLSDSATYVELKGGQEAKVFAVDRPLKHYELIQAENGHYLVFHQDDGLRPAEGKYHFARFKEDGGYVTYLDRNPLSVSALNALFKEWGEPAEIGSLQFSAGTMTKANVQPRSQQVYVPPNSVGHPQANLGGWFSLQNGFYPKRSPNLGDHTTVDELLHSKETLAPGRDGVKVDREIKNEEMHQLAQKLGGVEIHSMWADNDYYLLSGNSRTTPSLDRHQHKRIFSLSHNHPNGAVDSSLPDRKVVKQLYLHTLQSFPFARLHPSTRVVANVYDDVVYARHFGPERGAAEPQIFSADTLGLQSASEVQVSVRPRGTGKGVFRLEVGPNFSAADGKEIRQSLLALAQKKGFETVTFEVELRGHAPERLNDLILQLQGNRLIFSMHEPRYNFDSGNYMSNDKIFVWHESIRDPAKQVSNADVWRGQ